MSRSNRDAATRRDYYEILGVERTATAPELKAAYRKIAVQHHPDKNPGNGEAEEKFKEAAEAYAVLSDGDKRARYDRFGHQGVAGSAAGPGSAAYTDLSDLFGDLFGFGDPFGRSRGGGRSPAPGADLRYDLELTFEEAAFGKQVDLEIPRLETCDTCAGSGAKKGTSAKRCETCGGRGQQRFQQGFFTVARTCPKCAGAGEIVSDPCAQCSGEGRSAVRRTLQVTIPPGVDQGARMRLSGEGEDGRFGGPSGDLYVVLEVEEHERYRREGAHVRSDDPIPYVLAVLGGEIQIETLHGPQKLEIPPGTQPGREFRLRGKGVARLDGRSIGDHLSTVAVSVPHPRELDEERTALLRRLGELDGLTLRESKGVLGKVKDFFS